MIIFIWNLEEISGLYRFCYRFWNLKTACCFSFCLLDVNCVIPVTVKYVTIHYKWLNHSVKKIILRSLTLMKGCWAPLLCLCVTVNKLYELHSRALFAFAVADTVWLVQKTERDRRRVVRVQTSLQHQIQRVRRPDTKYTSYTNKKQKKVSVLSSIQPVLPQLQMLLSLWLNGVHKIWILF